jgi:hypothetical protein
MFAVSPDVADETGSGFGLQARGGFGLQPPGCGESRIPDPGSRIPTSFLLVRCLLTLCLALLVPACAETPEPITLDQGTVVVLNQTSSDWRNVVITVNDHFRGGTPTLAAGGRMAAPLTQFQTAFGQRFDRVSQGVTKIELTATDASGQPVALAWTGAKADEAKD